MSVEISKTSLILAFALIQISIARAEAVDLGTISKGENLVLNP